MYTLKCAIFFIAWQIIHPLCVCVRDFFANTIHLHPYFAGLCNFILTFVRHIFFHYKGKSYFSRSPSFVLFVFLYSYEKMLNINHMIFNKQIIFHSVLFFFPLLFDILFLLVLLVRCAIVVLRFVIVYLCKRHSCMINS